MRLYRAIAGRIRQLCNERDCTISHICDLAGIPSSSVKNLLYDKSTNPGILMIYRLCDAFGITLEEFFRSDLFGKVVED